MAGTWPVGPVAPQPFSRLAPLKVMHLLTKTSSNIRDIHFHFCVRFLFCDHAKLTYRLHYNSQREALIASYDEAHWLENFKKPKLQIKFKVISG